MRASAVASRPRQWTQRGPGSVATARILGEESEEPAESADFTDTVNDSSPRSQQNAKPVVLPVRHAGRCHDIDSGSCGTC